jgi:hypothetical protein
MRFIKSIVAGVLPLIRRYPAVLSALKWILRQSGYVDRVVKYYVSRSLEVKPSLRLARLSNAELRTLMDLKQAVELNRNRAK